MELTQKYLKQRLLYEPETGDFYWKTVITRPDVLGKKAGCIHPASGYVEIGLNRKIYKAHRLAWLYVYGVFPKGLIDHINRNRIDNRIANLREVNKAENLQNQTLRAVSKTGFMGASFNTQKQKYVAQITVFGKKIYLGQFDSAEEAHQAYMRKKVELHIPYQP